MRIGLMWIAAAAAGAAQGQADWPVYGHDPGSTRFSPLKQITAKNVAKLQVAWTLDTQAPLASAAPPGGRGGRARRSESTPLVIGGVMYLSTSYSRVLALEPETGKKIWEYESPHNPALRGVAYWPGDSGLPRGI
jgi:quinoprotein glucose dehydrogenase